MNKKLYNKIIKSIKKGLYESSMFDDDIFNDEENILSELDVNDKISKYKLIDLGLPSGTLWMDRNIGAKKITDTGNYFLFSRLIGFNNVDSPNINYETKIPSYSGHRYKDGDTLLHIDDAVYKNTGRECMIPTNKEILELINNTMVSETTVNGVNGMNFKGPNGNILFIPCTGYYDGDDLEFYDQYTYINFWGSSVNCANYADYLVDYGNGQLRPHLNTIQFNCGLPLRGVKMKYKKDE